MPILLVLAFALLGADNPQTKQDTCPVASLAGIVNMHCQINEESHGWKLFLVLRYQDRREWRVLEKPADGRAFWRDDTEAFGRCYEWRKCVKEKLKDRPGKN